MENKDQMSLGKSKNKFLILASTLFVLLIVLLVLVMVNNKPAVPGSKMATTTPEGSMTGSGANRTPAVVATAPPMVTVASWVGITAPASVPTSASVYTFKTGYTFDEAQMMAQNLGIQGKVQRDSNSVIAYSTPTASNKNASLLAFKLTNGTFIYNSSEGVALPAGSTTEAKVTALLKTLGVYDSTLTAVSTYKDKTQDGVLFVEVHRDWKKVGLPILNPVGLLNVPEAERLATLSLASKNSNLPQNTNIYATSDRTDGYVRKDDFNTVTVGINEATQKVMSIKSNIRPFATAAPNTSSLLTFEQAVDKLKMGQYEFALTSPSGTGSEMPWDKIYPQNRAEVETATVTDSVIVYLENAASSNQTELKPYYIFRANATLKSGYGAKIIAAVAATAQTSAWFMPFGVVEAQTPTTVDQGQKQGTFDLTTSPAVTNGNNTGNNNPVGGTPVTNVQDLSNGSPCLPSVAELSPIYNIGGANYGWAPYAIWGNDRRTEKEGYWYYIPTEGDNALLANLQTILNSIQNGVPAAAQGNVTQPVVQQQQASVTIPPTNEDDQGQKQGTFEVPTVAATQIPVQQVQLSDIEVRVISKVITDVNRIAEYCPLRVTGSSPTVFIYGQTGSNVQVQSGADISYADPSSNVWNVTIGDNSLLVNGLTRDWIYYEYENASFARPAQGWNVSKSELGSLGATVLSKKLGLTAQEAKRLNFELAHAASRVNADTVFVGLIAQNEVDSQLPFTVTAGYAVHRVYFYVGAAGSAVSAPSLEKIVRSPSMVVELGSYGQK